MRAEPAAPAPSVGDLAGLAAAVLAVAPRAVGGLWLRAGAGVARAFTVPYAVTLWVAAGLALAAVVGGFAFVMGRNWSSLH